MKSIFTLATSLILAISATAQVNGPLAGSSFSSSPLEGFCQTWTNAENVAGSNDAYATIGNLQDVIGAHSNYLVITNFGFDVPPAAVIKGIKVEVERSDPGLRTADYSIRIVKGGEIGSVEKSTGASYPASDAYITYGGPLDTWGESWSYKSISNGDFGIAIAVQRKTLGGISEARIDDVRVTVYYSFTTLPLTLTSFTATKNERTVSLKWTTATEREMESFTIERSTDGRIFHSIGTVAATNQQTGEYSFTDENPLRGGSYYRLSMKGNAGDLTISKIVPVHFGNYTVVSLSPSPWTKGKPLSVKNPNNERFTILFYKSDGTPVGKAQTSTNDVPVPALADVKGLIYFKVTDDKNSVRGNGSILVY